MKPRLRYVRSLAIAMEPDAARAMLTGLGAEHTADADAWTLADSAILVVPPTDRTPPGFIPLFVTDDLQRACTHYLTEGLQVRDLPWDPMARAVLVGAEGPGAPSAWICVAERTALYDADAPFDAPMDEPTIDEGQTRDD